jgi:hypothetical protein
MLCYHLVATWILAFIIANVIPFFNSRKLPQSPHTIPVHENTP